MSKKIAILSAIMLIMGGISIPGGIVINNIIDSTVTDRMDEGLSGIEEQFIPIGEDKILKMGPAIALKTIKENAISAYHLRVMASFLTQFLYQAYEEGEGETQTILDVYVDGGDALTNLFFDYNTLYLGTELLNLGEGDTSFSEQLIKNNLPGILGISQWWSREKKSDIDLEIGYCDYEKVLIFFDVPQPHPNQLLAWGDPTQRDVDFEENDPPGFLQHREFGFGILQFLEDYENAVTTGDHVSFLNQYNQGRTLQWDDFVIVARYFYEYWVPEAMPILLAELQDPTSEFSQRAPEYVGMDLDDISYHNFLKQWIDFAVYSEGMDIHDLVEDIPEGTHGLEVGSTISLESAYDLWDENNKWSFLNIEGIKKWYDANSISVGSADRAELATWFDINPQEVQDILNWLWDGSDSFSQGLLTKLLESEHGYNMPFTDLARRVMLEQWANGTMMGKTMLEDGIDFHDFISSLPIGSTGFEVGIPIPTGMSVESSQLLWDTSNPYSLVKDITVWRSIKSKESENYAIVRNANKLNDDEMDMILEWLPEFIANLMPALAQSETGLPVDTTNLGNVIQILSITVGAIAIGLASTGIVSNVIVSKKRKSVIKGDKTVKKFDKLIGNLRSLSQGLHEDVDSGTIPIIPISKPPRDEIKINKLNGNLRSLSQELHEDVDSGTIPINHISKPPYDETKYNKLKGNLRSLSKELQEDLDSKSSPIVPQSKPRDD